MNPSGPSSPLAGEAPAAVAPTICVEYCQIEDRGFLCSVLTRADVVEIFRDELIRYCTELGFQVVTGNAEYRVSGKFLRLEEGSRLLRSLLPGVFGAVKIHAVCRLTRGNQVLKEMNLTQRKSLGFQGGNTRNLIELGIRQMALSVGSDAGVAAGRIPAHETVYVARYLAAMTVVVFLVTLGLAWLAYQWAITIPVRADGVEDSGKPLWACVVAVFTFALLFLLGLATAPASVLKSRMLLPLRSASGVQSITAQRIVIALLAGAPLGLLYLCYKGV